jgi:hypothetical protein
VIRWRRLRTVLFIVAAGNLAVLLWDLATGGIYFKVFGHVVSSSDTRRPFWAAAACGAVVLWLRDRGGAIPTWDLIPRCSRWIAAAAAVTCVVVAVQFGAFVAGGADSYGYVSEADLWATGRLVMPDGLAGLPPWLGRATAPVGYRPALKPGAIVPIYSPGFPLAMALAQRVAGSWSGYYVVPLLGGLAVWLTYTLAERSFGAATAVMACVLFAASPLFLFHTLEVMSDVPVTAWWLAAWVFGVQAGRWMAFAAGLAAAAAILTRPNIVVLAAVLTLVVAGSRPRVRRVLLFTAPVVAACVAIALFNRVLYGSPLESGYGPLGYLFQTDRITRNLQRYFTWLVDLHTPVILLALAAPVVHPTRRGAWMLIFSAILLACYLPYFAFDTWPFLRFLLPAIPLLFILASLVIVRAIEQVPVSLRTVCLIGVCVAGCLWYGFKSERLGLFAAERAEDRYQVVGEYLGRALPANAVVITVIQSGSIRWYGNRATLRWDFIPDGRFDEAIGVLSAQGYEPYLLIEDHEEATFREHFATSNIFGRIDWPPAIEYQGPPRVRVYGLADRARHISGEHILPRVIPADYSW